MIGTFVILDLKLLIRCNVPSCAHFSRAQELMRRTKLLRNSALFDTLKGMQGLVALHGTSSDSYRGVQLRDEVALCACVALLRA